jgi:hypothetical protein
VRGFTETYISQFLCHEATAQNFFFYMQFCYLIHNVFSMRWINPNIRYWEDIDFIYLSLLLEEEKQKCEPSSGGGAPAICRRSRLLSNRFYTAQCNGRKHSDGVNTEHTTELHASGSVGHEIKNILHWMHRHVLPFSIYQNLEDWWKYDKDVRNCVEYRTEPDRPLHMMHSNPYFLCGDHHNTYQSCL